MGLRAVVRRIVASVVPVWFDVGAVFGPQLLPEWQVPTRLEGRRLARATVRGRPAYRAEWVRVVEAIGQVAECELTVDVQPSGRYRGGPRITARIEGIGEVGQLPARYQRVEADFFDAVIGGERRGWVAVVDEGRRRTGARLLVPARTAEPVEWDPSRIVRDSYDPEAPPPAGMPAHGLVARLPRGRLVQVSGEAQVAELLEGWLAGDERREMVAVLWPTAADGVTDGRVHVRIHDHRIGALGEVTSQRPMGQVRDIADRGLQPVADAVVVRRAQGPQVLVGVGRPAR